MASEQDVLDGVRANPDDDRARLVAADWYEDRGEAERAGFIRDQVAFARLDPWTSRARRHRDRANRALNRFARTWLASWPRTLAEAGIFPVELRRGFPVRVRVRDPEALPRVMGQLRDVPCIEAITLDGEDLERLPDDVDLSWLTGLYVEEAYDLEEDVLARLLERVGPGLTTLSLRTCGIENQGAIELARSPVLEGLRHLDLSECYVGNEGLEHLLDSGLSSLQSLELASYGSGYVADPFVTAPGLQLLAERGAPSLRSLSVNGGDDAAMRALLASRGLPELVELRMKRVGLTGAAFSGDEGVLRLRALDVRGNRDLDIAALAKRPELSELVALNLHGVPLAHEGTGETAAVDALIASGHSERLEILSLARCGMQRDALERLVSVRWPRLTHLRLDDNEELDLAPIRTLQAPLQHLSLNHLPVGDGLRHVGAAPFAAGLEELRVLRAGLTGAFEALTQLTSLRVLSVYDALARDVDPAPLVEAIAALSATLEELRLQKTRLRPDSFERLAEAGPWPVLSTLQASYNDFDVDCLVALLGCTPELQVLDAGRGSFIQEDPVAGAKLLAALESLPALTVLDLTGCSMDASTAVALLDGPVGARLHVLRAHGNRTTPDVWQRLNTFESPSVARFVRGEPKHWSESSTVW